MPEEETRREEFLETMDGIIPWDKWVGVIAPYYPSDKRGRPPMGVERMLRMYLLQIGSISPTQPPKTQSTTATCQKKLLPVLFAMNRKS